MILIRIDRIKPDKGKDSETPAKQRSGKVPESSSGNAASKEDNSTGAKSGEKDNSQPTPFERGFKVVVADAWGFVYGSHDRKFSFLSIPDTIPINPFVYAPGITHDDFDVVKMDDPRKEDINTLIAIAARGNHDDTILQRIRDMEDELEDPLLPSLFKHVVRKATTIISSMASNIPKRPMLVAAPRLTYNTTGWIGPRQPIYGSGRNSKRVRPRTRSLVHTPLLMAKLPLFTRERALARSGRLVSHTSRKPLSI